MIRVLLLIIGYCCGLLQTGYLYGKMKGVDIRKQGSGNSGATNTLRVLGAKAGIIVFFGDMLKCLIPCLIVHYALGFESQAAYVYMMYMAIGVILGHNFPFYMGFKGGKGIACTAGWVIALDWRITLIGIVVFFGIAIATRFVSLGSVCVVTAVLILCVLFGQMGWMDLGNYALEFYILVLFTTVMAIWRHRSNINRLIHETENRIGSKK